MVIRKLILKAWNLATMKSFYQFTLGLEPIAIEQKSASFRAGLTTLEFVSGNPSGAYHFAFNIPPFSIEKYRDKFGDSLQWLKFKEKSVVDFPSWKAKSLYFLDPDHNIVEFISRDELPTAEKEHIVSIGEIGLPTMDVSREESKIREKVDVPDFKRSIGDENFKPIGDDSGLIILVKTRRKWFPTDYEAVNRDIGLWISQGTGRPQSVLENY